MKTFYYLTRLPERQTFLRLAFCPDCEVDVDGNAYAVLQDLCGVPL